MIHQFELGLYVLISLVLLAKTMQRPIWAVAYYMLNFFAQPDYWSWGQALTNPGMLRWSLLSGVFLTVVVLIHRNQRRFHPDNNSLRAGVFLVLGLANAGVVHFLGAYDRVASYEVLVEFAKFNVLYFVMIAAVRSQRDFFLLLVFFTVGLGYWGFEAKFIGLTLENGRLEYFGGPGCANSNELASIIASLLPLVGCLLFVTKGVGRLMTVFASGLALNTLLLCNSRGGFLGAIAGIPALFTLTRSGTHKYAIYGLTAAALGTFVLAGNPKIMSRFLSTFTNDPVLTQQVEITPEKIDQENKSRRLLYWSAAMNLLGDKPWGNGGNCFKAGMGDPYLFEVGLNHKRKSCHQGFLEIAMAWGIQGLFLHLGFLGSAGLATLKVLRFQSRIGNHRFAFVGICILSGFAAFLVTSFFGSVLHLEWGYWLSVTAVTYAKIYGEKNYDLSGYFPTNINAGSPDPVFVGAQ